MEKRAVLNLPVASFGNKQMHGPGSTIVRLVRTNHVTSGRSVATAWAPELPPWTSALWSLGWGADFISRRPNYVSGPVQIFPTGAQGIAANQGLGSSSYDCRGSSAAHEGR